MWAIQTPMSVLELRVFVNIVAATADLTTHGELLEAVLKVSS